MNRYAYLRVGPRGRIYIPAAFHEQIGLPDGPAFIEAKLCEDGFIELGPVIPGVNAPRVSEVLPGLVVDEPFDDSAPVHDPDSTGDEIRRASGHDGEDPADSQSRVRDIRRRATERSAGLNRPASEADPVTDFDSSTIDRYAEKVIQANRPTLTAEYTGLANEFDARQPKLPVGWIVTVNGGRVFVLRIHPASMGQFLSPDEARALALFLRLKALEASLSGADPGGPQ